MADEHDLQGHYTLKDAAGRVGRSVSWLRGHIRKGNLSPSMIDGKYGAEYRLSAGDIDKALSLIPVPRSGLGGVHQAQGLATRAVESNLVLRERVTDLERDLVEANAKAEVAEERHAMLEERLVERGAESAEWKTKAEEAQTRVESLKALSVLDRLRGRHKGI